MAIQTASAALTANFQIIPVIGFVEFQQGIIDDTTGFIKAQGTGRWANASTWSSFTNYSQNFDQIKWTAPVIDVGSVRYFNLSVQSQADGDLFYIIHVDVENEFAGNESEYVIENGDFNVSAFYGRYVRVTAVCSGRELQRMTVTTDTKTIKFQLPDVDSSLLSGTITARTIPLPVPISGIVDIVIQPRAATSYAVNLYVSDTATSEVLIPVVKSKSSTAPSFALYGIDNDARNGIVDIFIEALPRQAMVNGNLIIIE